MTDGAPVYRVGWRAGDGSSGARMIYSTAHLVDVVGDLTRKYGTLTLSVALGDVETARGRAPRR